MGRCFKRGQIIYVIDIAHSENFTMNIDHIIPIKGYYKIIVSQQNIDWRELAQKEGNTRNQLKT